MTQPGPPSGIVVTTMTQPSPPPMIGVNPAPLTTITTTTSGNPSPVPPGSVSPPPPEIVSPDSTTAPPPLVGTPNDQDNLGVAETADQRAEAGGGSTLVYAAVAGVVLLCSLAMGVALFKRQVNRQKYNNTEALKGIARVGTHGIVVASSMERDFNSNVSDVLTITPSESVRDSDALSSNASSDNNSSMHWRSTQNSNSEFSSAYSIDSEMTVDTQFCDTTPSTGVYSSVSRFGKLESIVSSRASTDSEMTVDTQFCDTTPSTVYSSASRFGKLESIVSSRASTTNDVEV